MTTATTCTALVIPIPAFSREITVGAEFMEEIAVAVNRAKAITAVPTSADEYAVLQLALSAVTSLPASLDKQRLKLTKPLRDADATVKAAVDAACKPALAEKARLKTMGETWAAAETIRIAKLRAEQEQRDREAAEAALAAQAEADRKAAEETDLAALLGFEEDHTVHVVEPVAPSVSVPPLAKIIPEEPKVTMLVEFEVLDVDKVPRAFLVVDIATVNAYKRDNKTSIEARVQAGESDAIIPGLRFSLRPDVRGRRGY